MKDATTQWKPFVSQIKSQVVGLIQILVNAGFLKPIDPKIFETVLSTNIETINNPNVIGKWVYINKIMTKFLKT